MEPELEAMCWPELRVLLWKRADAEGERPLTTEESELLDRKFEEWMTQRPSESTFGYE